jgi:hypothetical protein
MRVRVPVTWLLVVLALSCAGCGDVQTPPPVAEPTPAVELSSPTPVPASDEEAIRFLLQAEGEGVVNKDIDRLMGLWAEEGFVADANHTPADGTDDLTWKGSYAVRDRYITAVFPGNPSTAAPTDLTIEINADRATVTATTRIGDEVSPAGDRWTFLRTPDGWRIESLTYNLEAE